MRQPAYQELRVSLTIVLLIVNVVCFLATWIVSFNNAHILFIQDYLALSLEGLRHGFLWQFFTFQFLHYGWLHLIFNGLVIYFFGRPVEMALGGRRFLALYLASGGIGGVLQMLFALGLPQYFDAPVVGASAGASGLVAAFAVLNWREYFTLFFYFIIPIHIRGRTLFWAGVAIAVIGILSPGSHIAHAAHLGGILTGFFYAQWLIRERAAQRKAPVARKPRREMAARLRTKTSWLKTAATPGADESDGDFLQREVDPILDKISAQGIQSLTAREREILETARRKMTRS